MKPSAAVYIAMPQNVSPNAIGFGHIKQSIPSFFGRRTIAVVHTSKRDYAAIIQRILKSEVKRDGDAMVLPAPTAPAKQE